MMRRSNHIGTMPATPFAERLSCRVFAALLLLQGCVALIAPLAGTSLDDGELDFHCALLGSAPAPSNDSAPPLDATGMCPAAMLGDAFASALAAPPSDLAWRTRAATVCGFACIDAPARDVINTSPIRAPPLFPG